MKRTWTCNWEIHYRCWVNLEDTWYLYDEVSMTYKWHFEGESIVPIIFRTFIREWMKALPTSSVPGVNEKLRWIPSTFVSKYRGTVEPSTAFTLLRSLEVLEATFGTGVIRNVLRRAGGKGVTVPWKLGRLFTGTYSICPKRSFLVVRVTGINNDVLSHQSTALSWDNET